jgi:hypothetical protein
MSLPAADRTELDRFGVENVRLKLPFANPGSDTPVPGLGARFGMKRGDVEEWLAEQTREAARLQLRILWWAKAAAWIGIAGIIIGVLVAIASPPFAPCLAEYTAPLGCHSPPGH